jgi:hypothetical protein
VYQQQEQEQEQEQQQQEQQDAENPFLDPPFSRIKSVRISLKFINPAHPDKRGLHDRRNKAIINVFPVCRVRSARSRVSVFCCSTNSADWKDIKYFLVTAVRQPLFIGVCKVYTLHRNSHIFFAQSPFCDISHVNQIQCRLKIMSLQSNKSSNQIL